MYEVQFHPADIRKQVKYFFLSRRSFRWIVTGIVVVAAILIAGAVLSPLGIQALLLSSKLRVLEQQEFEPVGSSRSRAVDQATARRGGLEETAQQRHDRPSLIHWRRRGRSPSVAATSVVSCRLSARSVGLTFVSFISFPPLLFTINPNLFR